MKNFIKRVCQGIPGILLCFLIASSVEAAHPELNDGQQPTSRIRQRKRKAKNIPEDAEQPHDKKLKQVSEFEAKCEDEKEEAHDALPDNDGHPKNLIAHFYKKFLREFYHDGAQPTQTMAYLNRPELLVRLKGLDWQIKMLGADNFESMFMSMLTREVEFKDGYRSFYHGQRRELMLFQDLYQGLCEIKYGIVQKDFILLRFPHHSRLEKAGQLFGLDGKIPCCNFSTFNSSTAFLKYYIKNKSIHGPEFDHGLDISPQVLSVNPSIFNNISADGECSFTYFFQSESYCGRDTFGLIKNLFDLFNYQEIFVKYRAEIKELQSILKSFEWNKTGSLLQIFVPEHLVDQLVYRCKPCGLIDWHDKNPHNHRASDDLDNYVHGAYASDELDEVQFRLLINELVLDPNNGIKFFRYCNETEAVKLYKQKLAELLAKIADDVVDIHSSQKSTPRCFARCWSRWSA